MEEEMIKLILLIAVNRDFYIKILVRFEKQIWFDGSSLKYVGTAVFKMCEFAVPKKCRVLCLPTNTT